MHNAPAHFSMKPTFLKALTMLHVNLNVKNRLNIITRIFSKGLYPQGVILTCIETASCIETECACLIMLSFMIKSDNCFMLIFCN